MKQYCLNRRCRNFDVKGKVYPFFCDRCNERLDIFVKISIVHRVLGLRWLYG